MPTSHDQKPRNASRRKGRRSFVPPSKRGIGRRLRWSARLAEESARKNVEIILRQHGITWKSVCRAVRASSGNMELATIIANMPEVRALGLPNVEANQEGTPVVQFA